jgi:FkbM family methyltransferase
MHALARETARPGHETRRRMLSAVRKAWLKRADPTIEYPVSGTSILLPFSHQLPLYQAVHPDYSLNLGRIARLVGERRADATIVDIGANVGDSVAVIRAATRAPILCVEGDEKFLPYLEINAGRSPDVEIAATYVRTTNGEEQFAVVREGGTARLEPCAPDGRPTVEVTPLADILAAHPRFASPALIKIDTDGQDTGILLDSAEILAARTPTLFFEFDVAMTYAASRCDAMTIFPALAAAGYRRALFFTNFGSFVNGLDVDQWDEIATLVEHAAPGNAVSYFDVCAFGPDDGELATEVEAAERAHALARKSQFVPG